VNYPYAALFGVFINETIFRTGKYLNRHFAWDVKPGNRFFIQLFAGIAIALVWVIVIRLSVKYFFFEDKLIIFSDEASLLILVITLISLLTLVEFGFFLNERYRRSLAEVERFRKENAEYQFEMLKLQLNPHFLFNSLNTLASLVYEDTAKAAEFTRRLSDVYRYVLDNRNRELVALKEEIAFINAFSFLLELRFQGMINFSYDISQASLEQKIAPMTMQLLVENAVKHNVVSARSPLEINISADKDVMSVRNNLQPKNEQPGTGTGLKNIVSRYAFLTDRKVEIIRDEAFFAVKVPLI
jgi:sensor histidine kinase YesM